MSNSPINPTPPNIRDSRVIRDWLSYMFLQIFVKSSFSSSFQIRFWLSCLTCYLRIKILEFRGVHNFQCPRKLYFIYCYSFWHSLLDRNRSFFRYKREKFFKLIKKISPKFQVFYHQLKLHQPNELKVTGTLVQIWKSAKIFVVIWKQHVEDIRLKHILLFEI